MRSPLRIVLFLLVLGIHIPICAINTSEYRFHTIPDILYHGGIQSITKDSLGRMWYSGRDVLYMYDGVSSHSMNEYVTPQDHLSHFSYNQLWTDKNKQLYVATNQGLLHFDYSSFRFEYILPDPVRFITSDNDGDVWVIYRNEVKTFSLDKLPETVSYTIPNGITVMNISCIGQHVYLCGSGKIYQIDKRSKQMQLFTDLGTEKCTVRNMLEYNGRLYGLTYENGLYIMDKDGTILTHHHIPFTEKQSIITKNIYLDASGVIWMGTQLGIYLFEPKTGETAMLQAELNNRFSLPQNSIWSLYPDPDGGVWLGTFGGRLVYMTFDDNMVDYIGPTTGGLNSSIVSCFAEDVNGNIWIGTEGGGVNLWNRKTGAFTYHTQYDKNSINFNLIKNLRYDTQKKNLLIAAFNGGISQYNTQTGTFHDMQIYYPNSTKQMNVYDYVMEGNTGIWITDPDADLYYKDLQTRTTRAIHPLDENGQETRMHIECLYRDEDTDDLWFITHQGICVMNTTTQRITRLFRIENAPYPVNYLHCYCVSSGSDIWVGTLGGGVNRLAKDGTYTNYNAGNGFHAKTVFGILEDTSSGNIWFSTDDGLYYYTHKDNVFHKAGINRPSLCGSFYLRAAYRTSKGEMLFGGNNGFIRFTPEKIRYNTQRPTVFFTDFYINNQQVTPYTRNSSIVLTHTQSNIEVGFSSNSYLQEDKNVFAYRMLGLSDQWHTLNSNQRSVTFFNLPAGSYTLEVKAANNDGLWGNQVSSLLFVVKPSPFLSVWAYIIYGLCVLGLLCLIWRYYTNKKIFAYELEMERVKEQNMKELTQTRINFFTNISHDLKTPLTLVIDPLKRLKGYLEDDHPGSPYVQLIERNVNRIQRMISQLLQFREIESKKITPNLQDGDLIKAVTEIFSLFTPYARNKKVTTDIHSYTDKLQVPFDYDMIEKIFSNLFSNAVKYSPAGASVRVNIHRASTEDNPLYISVEVTNTGVAIAPDKKDLLFQSFSRLSSRRPAFEESTGLGLSIVKGLVDTLNGDVTVDSNENQVSFRVTLPFASALREMSDATEPFGYDYTKSELKNISLPIEEPIHKSKQKRKKYSVVIVEDDATLRDYMEKELSPYYNVHTTVNGLEGIAVAENVCPQVVITDLMMPEADGFEVCRQLRINIKTSHIPIIILSALGGNTGNKIKGLKEGADVFIEKPFDMSFLLLQVNNMIKSRNQLKALYSKKYIAEPTKVTISSIDEELLKKAMAFIESNIDNSEYDVEAFTSDMGMGRTLLYQKINEIVGMSIKEFILDVRLKRSAQLLKESEYTIAEIAYLTGFSEAKYFSVCFKKHFGVSPTEFKKKGSG